MPESTNHTQRLNRRQFALASVAVATAVGGLIPTAIVAEETDVAEVLEQASLRLAEIQSLHFTLDVDGETIIDDSGAIRLESAEGDLSRPDRVAVEFRVSIFGAGSVSIKMITVGDESWTTDLITGNWGDAPPEFGYNPSILYDNQEGLGPVMGKLETATLEGTEEISGRDAYRITGTVASTTIAALTADTMVGDPVSIEIWIDTETWDLLQVRVAEPESDEKDDPATWMLVLSKFNEEVSIEPPV